MRSVHQACEPTLITERSVFITEYYELLGVVALCRHQIKKNGSNENMASIAICMFIVVYEFGRNCFKIISQIINTISIINCIFGLYFKFIFYIALL